jgi:adenosylcobyric acid synthase
MAGRALMVQGCSSSTGKSYLTAALCRLYVRRGVRVALFKAQNMSNNAGVTPQGLEMGRAQLTQALAARVTPDVRMNPVLIKPEGDTRSQVVVLGKRDDAVAQLPWTARKERLWPIVQNSLQSLLEEFELVVIEGAGSPAEVNLKAGDIVNMRVAREARARVLLAADIDRGGAFAHLLGTWGCLNAAERETLLGFVLNKFRGDPALLGDGTDWLKTRTGVPTLGVVPYLPLALPEEDAHTLSVGAAARGAGKLEVALIRFPTVSNFDEFDPLAQEPGVALRWAETPEGLTGAGLIILPGSKHVAADGAWLAQTGLAAEIRRRAEAGVPILGVCGGLQLLGERVSDPHGVEGGRDREGLGLLELDTTLETDKVVRLTQAELSATGTQVVGYEIHHGRSRAWGETQPYLSDGLGFQRTNVTGVYLHGLFENTAFRTAFLGALGVESRVSDWAAHLDGALDTLADHVEAHLEMAALDAAVFGTKPAAQTARSRLILVTGGARSGKSRYAEALVTHYLGGNEPALYLATLSAGDDEMGRRIAAHRARRPESWRTLETPLAPATALSKSSERVILLDCLSGLIANILLADETEGEDVLLEAVVNAVDELIRAAQTARKTLVIVTNEVGSGVVPAYPLGRRYRDALGLANARVAAAADAVALCVVGLPQTLKGRLPEVSLDSQ